MKNTFFLILLIAVFSCKDQKSNVENQTENPKETSTKIILPNDISTFGKVATNLEETTESYLGQKAYILANSTEDSNSSFLYSRKVTVDYEETHRASIIVKKRNSDSFFGLRMQGIYPDRVDAVFDLETGSVKGVKAVRDFEEETANIIDLGDDWYECSVTASIVADDVIIMFGPTHKDAEIAGWTHKEDVLNSILIVPSSLTLEKLTIE